MTLNNTFKFSLLAGIAALSMFCPVLAQEAWDVTPASSSPNNDLSINTQASVGQGLLGNNTRSATPSEPTYLLPAPTSPPSSTASPLQPIPTLVPPLLNPTGSSSTTNNLSNNTQASTAPNWPVNDLPPSSPERQFLNPSEAGINEDNTDNNGWPRGGTSSAGINNGGTNGSASLSGSTSYTSSTPLAAPTAEQVWNAPSTTDWTSASNPGLSAAPQGLPASFASAGAGSAAFGSAAAGTTGNGTYATGEGPSYFAHTAAMPTTNQGNSALPNLPKAGVQCLAPVFGTPSDSSRAAGGFNPNFQIPITGTNVGTIPVYTSMPGGGYTIKEADNTLGAASSLLGIPIP